MDRWSPPPVVRSLLACVFACASACSADPRAPSPGAGDLDHDDDLAVGEDLIAEDASGLEDLAPDLPDDIAPDLGPPWTPPPVSYPDEDSTEPFWLSQVGLYRDIATRDLAPDLVPFEPTTALWSDGTDKDRWLRMPPDAAIDTADMDFWQLPIGAQLFKTFSRHGQLLETRLIARLGPGRYDYWMGAFVWNAEGTDALFTREAAPDVGGTSHDVPSAKRCWTCHNGEPGHALGLSAMLLPPDQLADLALAGYLSVPPNEPSFAPPGDPATSAALEYLHVNCGACHNVNGSAWPDTDMTLRVSVHDQAPQDTALYASTLGVPLQNFDGGAAGLELRVAPGDPDASALLYRMTIRGPKAQMPPFASEIVHAEGVALVRAWILSLEGR